MQHYSGKKIMLVLLFSAMFGQVPKAQDTIPEAVTLAFNAKYLGVDKVEWRYRSYSLWQANFEINGQEVRAEFFDDRHWYATFTKINTEKTPEAVLTAVGKDYPNFVITKSEKVERDRESLIYLLWLEKGEYEKQIEFFANGNEVEEEMDQIESEQIIESE